MKKELINHLTWLVNGAVRPYIYNNNKNYKEVFDKFYESLEKSGLIEWDKLTVKEARELRFSKWASDEDVDNDIKFIKEHPDKVLLFNGETIEEKMASFENIRNLYLIPLWLYPLIPKGMKLYSISGREIINDGQLDSDIRCGCIAYGIRLG